MLIELYFFYRGSRHDNDCSSLMSHLRKQNKNTFNVYPLKGELGHLDLDIDRHHNFVNCMRFL